MAQVLRSFLLLLILFSTTSCYLDDDLVIIDKNVEKKNPSITPLETEKADEEDEGKDVVINIPDEKFISICDRKVIGPLIAMRLKITNCEKIKRNDLLTIKKLSVAGESIKSISQSSFQGLRNLEYLSLYNNSIKRIEKKSFKDLINLKELSLSKNHINFISKEAFEGLSNLEELYLAKNKLRDLDPLVFENLHRLKIIDLSNNELSTLDSKVFESNLNLKYIDLSNNFISFINQDQFVNQFSLHTLDIMGNPDLHYLPENFLISQTSLSRLYIPNNLCEFDTDGWSEKMNYRLQKQRDDIIFGKPMESFKALNECGDKCRDNNESERADIFKILNAKSLKELEQAYGTESFHNIRARMSNLQIEKNNKNILTLFQKEGERNTSSASKKLNYVSQDQIRTLYSDMTNDKNVKWNNGESGAEPFEHKKDRGVELGYCFGRATIAHSYAFERGVSPTAMKKIWALGPMNSGGTNWQLHVAFLVKRNDGNWLSIDNYSNIKNQKEWIEYMDSKHRTEYKKIMYFVSNPKRFSSNSAAGYNLIDLFNLRGGDFYKFDKRNEFYKGYFHTFFSRLRDMDIEAFKAVPFNKSLYLQDFPAVKKGSDYHCNALNFETNKSFLVTIRKQKLSNEIAIYKRLRSVFKPETAIEAFKIIKSEDFNFKDGLNIDNSTDYLSLDYGAVNGSLTDQFGTTELTNCIEK